MKSSHQIIGLVLVLSLLSVQCQKSNESTSVGKGMPAASTKAANAFTLDPSLSFVDVSVVKDGQVEVKGTLTVTHGQVTPDGTGLLNASFRLPLASYQSGLDLRDVRVRDLFFQIGKPGFSEAKITANGLPEDVIKKAQLGDAQKMSLAFEMEWATLKKVLVAPLIIEFIDGALTVRTETPISLSIHEWGFEEAKNNLIKACAHQEIKDEVKINLNLKFE